LALRHDCFFVYDPADLAAVTAFVDRFRDVFVPRVRGVSDVVGLVVGGEAERPAVLHRIREKYIWEARLTIVLTGRCTWARRYVDWELAAALTDDEIGPRTALLGIRLPYLGSTAPAVVPERFADNVDAAYATFRGHPVSSEELRYWVEGALVQGQYGTPDNSRALRLDDADCPPSGGATPDAPTSPRQG
jgi:hypothetical protein